jgi:hypothetical protein
VTSRQPIPMSRIRLDGGTQPRTALNFEVVEDYSAAMGAGAQFPPVAVFYDGTDYWLADGFHRVKAAYAAGHDTIECEVRQGRLEDAQWYSFSANKTNGLRRTTKDKQRAVKAALLHPNGAVLSDHQIARHVGVDQKTVTNWRHELQATEEIPQSNNRTGSDGRTINVANIGRPAALKCSSASVPAQETDAALPLTTTANPDPSNPALSPAPRTTRSQRIDHLARSILSLIEVTRHFAQLVGWFGETAGEFAEAERLLSNVIDPIAAINAELERKAIAADPLNATRLGIQENRS